MRDWAAGVWTWIGLVWLAGCADTARPADESVEVAQGLAGTWIVRALEVENTCPDFGSMAPVGPGPVTVAPAPGGWQLTGRDMAEPVAYAALAADRWGRSVRVPYEGCELEGDADWAFEGVGETRFLSRYRASYRVFGAACGYPVERCEVAYTVTGSRP
jgi:hypothetical protein